jgi:1-deoxy-D-xylulose-5-phosphate reductoisomerase
MKKVIIFGSSGSVGRNALDVIRKYRKDFSVYGLCVYKNLGILKRQVEEFKPRYVCIVREDIAKKAKDLFSSQVKIFSGKTGLEEFSFLNSDISVMGIAGLASLKPLLINIKHTKRIALANKESFVVAASLVKKEAARYSTEVLPVDSEISALFQLFNLINKDHLRKVYLTASGGALFKFNKLQLEKVTPKAVLSHPTWKMGKRITVDSATLVNKGFEVIETHEFFDLNYKMVDIVIHPESRVHSLIELRDGIVFSCLYKPDMRIPLGYAFYYPHRVPLFREANFRKKMHFTFIPLDYKKFPLLNLVLKAAQLRDNSLVVINASDEVAIDYFLKGKITFLAIYKAIEYVFSRCRSKKISTLEDILFWDNWARAKTKEYLERRCLS